jgi:hypothetical protein
LTNWLLIGKPVVAEHRDMSTNWIPQLVRAFAALFQPPLPEGYPADTVDHDADRRRIRSELDAIRVHSPDPG